MPAMGMDHTNHSIMLCSVAHAIRRATTIIIFKITGAAAAVAKRPVVFKIPENKAAREMNSI